MITSQSSNNFSALHLLFFIASVLFILLIHGSIPFLTISTLGNAVWTTGFSLSFTKGSIFHIYAKNFGLPTPAPIAFGLMGAWSSGLLIKLGFAPADAYTFMFSFWLTLAFYFAYKLGRFFGASPTTAILGSVLWLSMPIVRGHDGLSMIALGIALLPFYFWAAINLFSIPNSAKPNKFLRAIVLYLLSAIIAAFMEGYSFMLFGVGSSCLGAYYILRYPELRKKLLLIKFPIHIVSFLIAIFLYTSYVKTTDYGDISIDFFRGWGVDLSFLVIPTRGFYWILDFLGLSVPRDSDHFFGDYTVWITTFCLPILILGIIGWICAKKNSLIATGFFLIGVFSFYMAMGPSIKINSIKTSPNLGSSMPATSAIASTGNAWISKYVPGFKTMRAAYRWSALGIFCCWLLGIIFLSQGNEKKLF